MSKSKPKQEIAHPRASEVTEAAQHAAFLEMVDLNERTKPPEPRGPFKCSPNCVAEIHLWNGAVEKLVAQRNLPTLALQAELMASVIEKAPYVLALVPTPTEWAFYWVKGRDNAAFGGEQAIFDDEAIAFLMPSVGWVELLLTGYGDCEASHQQRDSAIWRGGQEAVQNAREVVTLMATEHYCGPQPDESDIL